MFASLQNPLSLIGRLLLALLVLPAGISKITGFAGTVGYVTSAGMPMPQVSTALALGIVVVGGLALILGVGRRWAALVRARFTLGASFFFHTFSVVPGE